MDSTPNLDLLHRQRTFSIDETREQLEQGRPVQREAVMSGPIDSTVSYSSSSSSSSGSSSSGAVAAKAGKGKGETGSTSNSFSYASIVKTAADPVPSHETSGKTPESKATKGVAAEPKGGKKETRAAPSTAPAGGKRTEKETPAAGHATPATVTAAVPSVATTVASTAETAPSVSSAPAVAGEGSSHPTAAPATSTGSTQSNSDKKKVSGSSGECACDLHIL